MGRDVLQSGTIIDGFLVGEKLHVGGMASLWRVTRDDIAFPVVLKTPLILDGDDATAIVGFEMEQMILPQLAGPHSPRCVASGLKGLAGVCRQACPAASASGSRSPAPSCAVARFCCSTNLSPRSIPACAPEWAS